jgi:hypothetical protein
MNHDFLLVRNYHEYYACSILVIPNAEEFMSYLASDIIMCLLYRMLYKYSKYFRADSCYGYDNLIANDVTLVGYAFPSFFSHQGSCMGCFWSSLGSFH